MEIALIAIGIPVAIVIFFLCCFCCVYVCLEIFKDIVKRSQGGQGQNANGERASRWQASHDILTVQYSQPCAGPVVVM